MNNEKLVCFNDNKTLYNDSKQLIQYKRLKVVLPYEITIVMRF